jgi:hypothetical protein
MERGCHSDRLFPVLETASTQQKTAALLLRFTSGFHVKMDSRPVNQDKPKIKEGAAI